MKKLMVKISWVSVLATLIVVASASAADAERIVARVPFAFIVGDVSLPAGNYIVQAVSDDPSLVQIVNTTGGQSAFTLTIPASEDSEVTQPELVFEKFETQYFLARLVPGDGNEREIVLTPGRMERAVATVASNQ